MGFEFVTCPTTSVLEKQFYPDGKKIARQAYHQVTDADESSWTPRPGPKMEEIEFKGPF
jgi:hypothetical protein